MENENDVDVPNYTTKEDYKLFMKECSYWIKKLSLLHYEWFFSWMESEDRANIILNDEGKIAQVIFSKIWYNVKPTPKRIRRCAYHEVLEALLTKLNLIAIRRNLDPSDLEGETHAIIRTLENTQFEDDYKKRFK